MIILMFEVLNGIVRKEMNVLFNDALNTIYLWLYGIRIMYKDQLDSERGNPPPPHGLLFPGKSVRSWCDGSSDRSFMVDPLSYFLFQPVLHDWFNKGCGMYYPVCGMVHIKEPLLLIRKSSLCGGSRFHLSLSEWSFTICVTPYNRK